MGLFFALARPNGGRSHGGRVLRRHQRLDGHEKPPHSQASWVGRNKLPFTVADLAPLAAARNVCFRGGNGSDFGSSLFGARGAAMAALRFRKSLSRSRLLPAARMHSPIYNWIF